ncbi:MAG: hypothetical protein NXI27_20875 [Alphaproteobacteria bacterium]|nr:hypothetical protein [Alphaproteobacteria bacterium]
MKSIIHSVYRGGAAGLSNLVMSVELGVVVASLTDRLLILKGNKTPVANVVQYNGLVSNAYPSRVTDLIDLGIPWINWDESIEQKYAAQDICDVPPWDAVFYFPSHMSVDSDDFRSFAKGRKRLVTIDDKLEHIPALSISGGKESLTLGYYSSFFYLGQSAQLQAYDALRGMKPKPEISLFSETVAQDIGSFNAVHIRRGDFKKTLGVTTLERQPSEVIEALDPHFSRSETLVIVTDEADDPFFDEIKSAFPQHIFIDHHILQNHHSEFQDLPAHDSIALAYISQLVAAQSQDFIGTMTSTFSGAIQRMRGNLGKEELFKYLWNELPPPGAKLERGRHAIGDDILLDKGTMVEDGEGPYSWNRVNQRLNQLWMREWPESFLDKAKMLERASGRELECDAVEPEPANSSRAVQPLPGAHMALFLGSAVTVSSDDVEITKSMANLFAMMSENSNAAPLGEVRIETAHDPAKLLVDGKSVSSGTNGAKLLRKGYREVVRLFIHQHPDLIWIHAACASSDRGAVVLPGSWGRGKSSLVLELCDQGWSFLSDDIVPIEPIVRRALPFPCTPQVRPGTKKALSRDELGALSKRAVPLEAGRVAESLQPVSMVVFPNFVSNAEASLSPISPAQAVGELLENCLSFPKNDDATIQALCDMVENLPVFSLRFGNIAEAARLVIEANDAGTVGVLEHAENRAEQ